MGDNYAVMAAAEDVALWLENAGHTKHAAHVRALLETTFHQNWLKQKRRADAAETALATATAEAASLRAEVEAKDRRIAELTETWTDEEGKPWFPPTAQAHAAICKGLVRAVERFTAAKAKVRALEGTLTTVKTWIDTELPAGTARAGSMHRVVTKALDRTALARAATAGEG